MRRRRSIDFDLTPIVDVVFILLIFFMVSSSFNKNENKLDITLPASEYGKKINAGKELKIELTETGISFNGRTMDFEGLNIELSKLKSSMMPIFSRINKDVRYERVINLFDLLKKYGLENIILVTEIKK